MLSTEGSLSLPLASDSSVDGDLFVAAISPKGVFDVKRASRLAKLARLDIVSPSPLAGFLSLLFFLSSCLGDTAGLRMSADGRLL